MITQRPITLLAIPVNFTQDATVYLSHRGIPITLTKMTDKEVLDFYNELVEHYGDSLANFEHYPKQFSNQVRLYKYYKEKNDRARSQQTE